MNRRTTIAFTSCTRFKFYKDQPERREIGDEVNPDDLFLLGDQIYMDWGKGLRPECYTPEEFREDMEKKYEEQWNEKHFDQLFSKLSKAKRVFGVWDDHDFARANEKNGVWCHSEDRKGGTVPADKKLISRELFHKWMNGSTNLPEVYCHVDIPHTRAIFLDNRYYTQPPGKDGQGDLLGDKQVKFLEAALQHNRQYTFIWGPTTQVE